VVKAMQTKPNYSIVITSINDPTEAIIEIAKKAKETECHFIVIGDTKSPTDFQLENCNFYSVEAQLGTKFTLAQNCPTRHYARKNIGYLITISNGSKFILETDDDNIPRDNFWVVPQAHLSVPQSLNQGWVNVYRHFTSALIWPRGLPLSKIHDVPLPLENLPTKEVFCPIQQGLADSNPDVDAIYRLVLPLPLEFEQHIKVALGQGSWCPFNSQNTIWFPEAYPLMYLPAYCSFRMTDIWRSFVAQRIAWENNWSILFYAPTVYQIRNEHDLMKDFSDEVIGYLHNQEIQEKLDTLKLLSGIENIPNNMIKCYEILIKLGVVGHDEMKLLECWLEDLSLCS
jgi:hypothetical protein